MDASLDIKKIESTVHPIFAENKVDYAALFGSFARKEARQDSDIDILVRFSETPGMFGFVRLEQLLGEKLGRKVDLVTEEFLSPYFRDSVLKEAVTLYGER